jgi:predicted AAA+ superfamily ATPase
MMLADDFEVQRTIYLDSIDKWIGTPVVKVLTGMRRVGKSILLRQISERLKARTNDPRKVLLVSTESIKYEMVRNHRDLHQLAEEARKESPDGRLALLVDEVQNVDHWERAVASLAAEGPFELFLTGSNASLLASDLATRIAGRYIEFPVFPLTFGEFIEFRKAAGSSADEAEMFRSFIRYGGLPGIHHVLFTDEQIDQYLNGIYSTIILRDVVDRYSVRNPRLLEDICTFLFDSIGATLSAKKIADYLKSQRRSATVDTVLNYVGFLESSYAIRRARRFDIRGKRHLEVQDKFFLGDIGLRYARLGHRDNDIAAILENIVFLELLCRGYSVSVGKVGPLEVDFVAVSQGSRIYIQVCYRMEQPETREREFRSLRSIEDNYPKIVLSLDDFPASDAGGIRHLNLVDFLLHRKDL